MQYRRNEKEKEEIRNETNDKYKKWEREDGRKERKRKERYYKGMIWERKER